MATTFFGDDGWLVPVREMTSTLKSLHSALTQTRNSQSLVAKISSLVEPNGLSSVPGTVIAIYARQNFIDDAYSALEKRQDQLSLEERQSHDIGKKVWEAFTAGIEAENSRFSENLEDIKQCVLDGWQSTTAAIDKVWSNIANLKLQQDFFHVSNFNTLVQKTESVQASFSQLLACNLAATQEFLSHLSAVIGHVEKGIYAEISAHSAIERLDSQAIPRLRQHSLSNTESASTERSPETSLRCSAVVRRAASAPLVSIS
ncbi:hypothetical protein BKA64DRAFT_773244 [Cadophora sp. MPI-SDFR-AT-0126]|nr:hypothetical protein BKA64DRAFT_773244 [Leotiomycetes sp. MPI-SDFR-AT-0126]